VAKGLYLMRDGQVLVEYGKRRVPISPAQYRANGYRPPCDKLPHEALPKAIVEAEFVLSEGRTKARLEDRPLAAHRRGPSSDRPSLANGATGRASLAPLCSRSFGA
jgi:hypothetical protein